MEIPKMKITPKTLIVAVLFAVSAFMFVGKLLMPTPIQIIIQGEEPIVVGQILRYTQFDVAIISISTIVLAASGFYLLFANSSSTQSVSSIVVEKESPKLDVTFALRLLDGDKRRVFSEIIDSNGEILQSDLHTQTGFSKAKITRILDYLELKGLILRKSYGMTNKIIINRNGQLEETEEK
jgi:uncharacterized membrane protein